MWFAVFCALLTLLRLYNIFIRRWSILLKTLNFNGWKLSFNINNNHSLQRNIFKFPIRYHILAMCTQFKTTPIAVP